MNRYIVLFSVFYLLFSACRQESAETDQSSDFIAGTPVTVSFLIHKNQPVMALDSLPSTRSERTENDFQVYFTDSDTTVYTRALTRFVNTWILQFDAEGNCITCTNLGNVSVEGAVTTNLSAGNNTTLYLLGNGPAMLVHPATLRDFEGNTYFSEETYTDADLLPYIAKATNVSISVSGQLATADGRDVVFRMKRIAARLSLTCTTDLPGYRITDVVLYNAPQKMYYNYSVPSAEVKRSPIPAHQIAGDTYTWFIGENRCGNTSTTGQQDRYTGNTPVNASFIRITAEAPIGCEITSYDIYPGQNLSDNYDLVRNWDYAYTTTITKAGTSVSGDQRTHDEGTPIDLTAQPSNCYVVEPGKSYKFRLDIRGEEGAAMPRDINISRNITVSDVTLLWQDQKNLVTTLTYVDNTTAIVCFNPQLEGNALVLGQNSAGTTEWNWHFWVIKGGLAALTSNEVNGTAVMDRNLGATVSGATEPGVAGFRGVIYEWGRKDPFPGSQGVNTNLRDTVYKINNSNSSVNRYISPISLEIAIQQPDWYVYMNKVKPETTPAWLTPVNNDLWGYTSDAKTIFDPCPYGWRVPKDHTAWENWNSSNFVWDASLLCSGYTTGIWFPAAGRYDYQHAPLGDSDHGFLNVGTDGYYWTGKAASGGTASAFHFSASGIIEQINVAQTYGCSVRPVRIK